LTGHYCKKKKKESKFVAEDEQDGVYCGVAVWDAVSGEKLEQTNVTKILQLCTYNM
jgi:hypothetical protein